MCDPTREGEIGSVYAGTSKWTLPNRRNFGSIERGESVVAEAGANSDSSGTIVSCVFASKRFGDNLDTTYEDHPSMLVIIAV